MGLGCFLSSVREIACVSRVFFFLSFKIVGLAGLFPMGGRVMIFFPPLPSPGIGK